MFCVDTGERGFPGPQGQKGDRGQSLHVILAVADITPAKMSKILCKMLHLIKYFFPQSSDMQEEKGRLDFKHHGHRNGQ